MSVVSTEWLSKNKNNVKIIDCSWHMPNLNRDPYKEYLLEHIKNAIFFDLDKNSEQNSKIPHMMPKKDFWENSISKLGIKNSDHIIVYDNSDVFSSCRVWYSFIFFGHDTNLISVLDGDFKKWLKENRPISKTKTKILKSKYKANANLSLVINKNQVNENIKKNKFQLVDARGKKRFLGLQPEPRKDLKSGHIKGSKNLPFQLLINDDRTFKKIDELSVVFKNHEVSTSKEMAFTCGSGVTACILGLANSIISGKKPVIYDGSWAEYGLKQ